MSLLPDYLGANSDPPDEFGWSKSRPIRGRNPGALKDFGWNWQGLIQAEFEHDEAPAGAHCVFKNAEYGFRAMAKNIRNGYFKRGRNTIAKVIERYAPRNVDNNATDYYIDYLTKRLGWDANALLPDTPRTMAWLCAAMSEIECGRENWWSKRQIEAGVNMAYGKDVQRLEAPTAPPVVSSPTPPRPKAKPQIPTGGIINGPLAGKRLELSLGAAALTWLGQALADPEKQAAAALLIDRVFIVALVAAGLFTLTRIVRIWKS